MAAGADLLLPEEILELVTRGLGDLARCELVGADAVGTDDYPRLRDAWPQLLVALDGDERARRTTAAYALALLVEPFADRTLPALEAAIGRARDASERAAMILAAGRLRATLSLWRKHEPEVPDGGLPLADDIASEPEAAVRAALVIAELWMLPDWNREVRPEVAAALEGLEGVAAGPWGGGDLGVLARRVRETLSVETRSTDWRERMASYDRDAEPSVTEPTDASFGDDDVADPYTQQRPVRAAPRIVLAGLRDVAWSELEHAYGTAEGVPGMIEALSSPEAADRDWGFDALDASIHHQGSVYAASAPAVPFLIELLGHDIEGRDRILLLLAGLAVHSPRWNLFTDLSAAASPAFAAVSAGAAAFVPLLANEDGAVRAAAAVALSFVTPPPEAAPAVRGALAMERDRYVRSSLLLALGYLGRRLDRDGDRDLLERHLDDDCGLLRASAAIAIAQIDRARTSARVREVLARTIEETPPVTGPWPWLEGDIGGFARTVRLAILPTCELLHEAEAARARGDGESAREYAMKAFGLALVDGVHGATRPWTPDELDATQQAVLRLLVRIAPRHEDEPPWLPMDVHVAHDAGVFGPVADALRLLGDETGPLDRRVALEGRDVPAWFALHAAISGRVDAVALDAALAPIDAPTRIEMIDEALAGRFGLARDRRRFDFSDPGAYARENDYTSAFITTLARLLDAAGDTGLARAKRLAAEQLAEEEGARDPKRALIAALAVARRAAANGDPAPADLDRLVRLDGPPASTYRVAIAELLGLLGDERAAAIVGDVRLDTYDAYRDPRGEVRRWRAGRGWDVVAWLGPEARAARVLASLREWERHRGAGDDPTAGPVAGVITTTQHAKPGPADAFPRDRAIALLRSCGAAGRAAIEAALADGDVADRPLLEEARRSLETR